MMIQEENKKSNLFIVAELSGNHNRSLDRALKLVEVAAKCGVSAVKLQTYTPDSLTLDLKNKSGFFIEDKSSLWYGRTCYDVYREAALPYDWHKDIFNKCKKLGLICFSTPFDFHGVDFLESLDVSMYKVASAELIDIPLLKKIADTKKPVIMSTGMASFEEIRESVLFLQENKCQDITLLKCTTSYPAKIEDSNLLTIPDLQKKFPSCKVGLSDHTLGIAAAIASISLGATVIEKHFTLSRDDGGVDSAFSIEPEEMKILVKECNEAYNALGRISYELTESEKNNVKYRRSLFVVQNIKKGETLTENNIRSIRPGFGLAPKHYYEVLGKVAKTDLTKGTPLSWEDIG
jgi:pseudaminic acid synthase